MGHFWNDIFTATTARHTRNTARNTKEANRLAQAHHAELMQATREATHYQRYHNEPAYREQVDAAWVQHRVQQGQQLELKRQKVAIEAERKNRIVRVPAFIVLAVAMFVVGVIVWLPQASLALVRRTSRSQWGRAKLESAWSGASSWRPFKPRDVGPPF